MHHATIKKAEIKLDIMKGYFDTSLEKYKPEIIRPVEANPSFPVQEIVLVSSVIYLHELSGKFTEWIKTIRKINIDNSIDYVGVRRV